MDVYMQELGKIIQVCTHSFNTDKVLFLWKAVKQDTQN